MRLRLALVLLVVALALPVALVVRPVEAYPPGPPPVATSYQQLDGLAVAAPRSMAGYSRDRFRHWTAQYGNCNTREVVLQRDGSGVEVGADCYPTTGRWYSVFDRVWVEDPSGVDIDHLVALANAWRSGADTWTDARREAFANDLDTGQLIAVSASSNRSKGDQSPDQWLPPNANWHCFYGRHWTNVKHVWGLTVTSAEKGALGDLLAAC